MTRLPGGQTFPTVHARNDIAEKTTDLGMPGSGRFTVCRAGRVSRRFREARHAQAVPSDAGDASFENNPTHLLSSGHDLAAAQPSGS